jgi:hypothetical protein
VTGYFRYLVVLVVIASTVLGAQDSFTQASAAADPPTGFPPLDQWRNAIVAGDAATLKALYSVDPVAQVQADGVAASAAADVNFWLGLKARSMRLEIVGTRERPGGETLIFKAEVQTGPNGETVSVTDARHGAS